MWHVISCIWARIFLKYCRYMWYWPLHWNECHSLLHFQIFTVFANKYLNIISINIQINIQTNNIQTCADFHLRMEVFVIWTLHRWGTLFNIRRLLQEFNWNKVLNFFEKIDILFIYNRTLENKIRYIKHKILICKQNSWNEHSLKAIVNIFIVSCYARGVLNWIELTIANKVQCY